MSLMREIENKFVGMNEEYSLVFLNENVGLIEAKDYENLNINMVYNNETISFSVILKEVPLNKEEKNEINEKMLKIMGLGVIPLSTFSIVNENGVDYYALDGKISTESKESVILTELNVLVVNAQNVIENFF